MWLGVVDEQPGLEVLTVVGEVEAEQFGVAAGCREPHASGEPGDVAAERDREVPQHRVLAQRGVVRADVDGVVGPVGDRHHLERRGVADDELDVVGVGSAAPVVDHHDGLAEFLDTDLHVPVGRVALAGTGDGDLDGLVHLHVATDGDHRRVAERRKCLCGDTIGGNAALAEALVAALDGLDRHAGALTDLDQRAARRLAVGARGAVVQAAQPPQRREPPDLVATVRDLEGVDVERGEDLALVQVEHRAALRGTLGRLCELRSHTQPTAPSI